MRIREKRFRGGFVTPEQFSGGRVFHHTWVHSWSRVKRGMISPAMERDSDGRENFMKKIDWWYHRNG